MAPGIATVAIVLLMLPVRSLLQRAVNRLILWRRGDP
jgi:hypothetical protein